MVERERRAGGDISILDKTLAGRAQDMTLRSTLTNSMTTRPTDQPTNQPAVLKTAGKKTSSTYTTISSHALLEQRLLIPTGRGKRRKVLLEVAGALSGLDETQNIFPSPFIDTPFMVFGSALIWMASLWQAFLPPTPPFLSLFHFILSLPWILSFRGLYG